MWLSRRIPNRVYFGASRRALPGWQKYLKERHCCQTGVWPNVSGMVKDPTRRIAILAYPDVQLLDVAGPLQVFASASELVAREGRGGPPAYGVEVLAARPGLVRTSSGLGIVASASWREAAPSCWRPLACSTDERRPRTGT